MTLRRKKALFNNYGDYILCLPEEDKKNEENGGKRWRARIHHHVHEIGPSFQGNGLKYGEHAHTDVVEGGDTKVHVRGLGEILIGYR
jgi:hypothetical protein